MSIDKLARAVASDRSTAAPHVLYEVTAPLDALDAPQLARLVPDGEGGRRAEPLDGRVVVEGPHAIAIDAPMPGPVARELARAWGRTLRDHGRWGRWAPGQKLTRFIGRGFVAVDEDEAQLLARQHHTPWPEVEVTANVELLHVAQRAVWALWSDGRVTTLVGLPWHCRQAAMLSPAAAALIGDVHHADAGPPKVAGGYLTLAQVAEELGEEVIEHNPLLLGQAPAAVVRVDVRMLDGAERSLWVFTAQSDEGYRFDVFDSLEQLHQVLASEASRGDA